MSIEDRNLKPGTKLVARYKKQDFTCEVVKTKDGIVYRLVDGKEFKSLSSAGSEVMGGSACNGWRFWSLEGAEKPATPIKTRAQKIIRGVDHELPEGTPRAGGPHRAEAVAKRNKAATEEAKAETTKAAAKTAKADLTIKPMKDDPTRFWCSACMDSFAVTEGETPTACPKGHTNAAEPAPAPASKPTKAATTASAKKTAKKEPAKRKAAKAKA